MPSFPTSVFNPATNNAGDTILAAHVNNLNSEVNAIEDGYENATARLNSSNSTLAALSVTGGSTFAGTIQSSNCTVTNLTVTGGSTHTGQAIFSTGISLTGLSSSPGLITSPLIQVGNNVIMSLGSSVEGTLFILADEDDWGGQYFLRGPTKTTSEITDAGGIFSASSGTANQINIYYSSGTDAAGRYELENKRGATRNVRLILLGTFN